MVNNYVLYNHFEKVILEIHDNMLLCNLHAQKMALKNIIFFIGLYHTTFHIGLPWIYKKIYKQVI
jgi:hypothetical protein